MADQVQRSWLARKLESAIRGGFLRAYHHVRVDPARFLMQLRSAHGLPVSGYEGMFQLDLRMLDRVAEETIHSGMRMAAMQGAGFGLGGALTLVPDMSLMAAITLRTIQKLSLIYGFEFNTDHEVAELWVATASAAGVDIGRELIEKELVNKFVPRVIQRIAVKASTEVVEKWAGRLIPLVSSVIGAGLNYYFVRAWGERAKKHFRAKHLEMRQRNATPPATISGEAQPANGAPAVLPPSRAGLIRS
jgi:uncharacterized protein (DUF697 family)